jgi:hypothetical protein
MCKGRLSPVRSDSVELNAAVRREKIRLVLRNADLHASCARRLLLRFSVSLSGIYQCHTHFDELFLAHGHAVLNQVRIIGNLRMDDAEHENVPMPQVSNKLKLASSSTMISVQKAWQLIPRLSCSILDVAERFEWLLSRIQTVLPIAAPFASNAAMIRRSKTSQVSTIDPIAISFFAHESPQLCAHFIL